MLAPESYMRIGHHNLQRTLTKLNTFSEPLDVIDPAMKLTKVDREIKNPFDAAVQPC